MRCKHCRMAVVEINGDYPFHCPWCAHQTMTFDPWYLEPIDGITKYWQEQRQQYSAEVTAADIQFLAAGHITWNGDTRTTGAL